MMPSDSRVAVIGAGIIGLCSAYYLRQAGMDVVVIDRGRERDGASYGNAGMLMPIDAAPLPGPGVMSEVLASLLRPNGPIHLSPSAVPTLATWLVKFMLNCRKQRHVEGLAATAALANEALALYDALAADGISFEMHAVEPLSVFANDRAALDHLRELEDMKAFGFAMPDGLLGRAELMTLEPALTGPAVRTGYLIPGQRFVDPRTVTKGLMAKLIAMGVQVLEGVSVVGFERVGHAVQSIKTSGTPVRVDQVLIAAGAWSTELCRLLGARLPVQAGKGYSFSVEVKDLPRRPLYLAEARIACTPMAGRLRLAGTMELSGTNLDLRMNRVAAICRGAESYLFGWSCAEKKDVWTGMRPMTPDGLPVMGAVPSCDNVFVATGHGMLGITLGPPSGKAVAQNMVTGTVPAVLLPFQFARHHL